MSGATAMTEEKVYTTEEVAEIIRAHVKTVHRLIQRGQLKAFTVGSQYRIRQSALDEFMGRCDPSKEKDRDA